MDPFHMRTILHCLPLLALTAAPPTHAKEARSCDSGTLAAVAQWARIKGKPISRNVPGGVIAAAACKAMPNAPDTWIAAVAFDIGHHDPNGPDGNTVQQVVALVEGGKVVAADRSVIEEDAATVFGGYRIDTAPYLLSPRVRAFGVVFDSSASGPSLADATAGAELTLWVREGERLRAVLGTNLDGWVVAEKRSGPDLGYSRSESAHMTIAVEKTASHGFADLSLTAHVAQSRTTKDGQVETGRRTVRAILRYDGKSYGSDMFRTFWYPSTSPMYSAEHRPAR